MSRPRIGLPTYVETARWGPWDRPAALLPHSYVGAVLAAGGLPVLLPPGPDRAAAHSAVDGIDALVLTGGADVEPVRYGAEPLATTQGARPDRDGWEVDLLGEALDGDRGHDMPVLAICRGAQVLNVAFGGTLHQHLPDLVGHERHQPAPAVLGATRVQLAAGTLAASILGAVVKVPCYHHQAIARLGDGIDAVGWADDGTIEAAVLRDRRFVLAVQWHPEDGDDPRLFEAIVAAAQEAR